jgi:hypothetical protein
LPPWIKAAPSAVEDANISMRPLKTRVTAALACMLNTVWSHSKRLFLFSMFVHDEAPVVLRW